MGSSRDIAIGPVAVVSLLLGTLLTDEISDYKSHEYLRLTFTATFFAGITQMALGILRYITVSLYCICKIILDLCCLCYNP
jgi:high affinity sulfate transporter 1